MRKTDSQLRFYAALLSLFMGILIMGLKFYVYRLTGSTAVLSDALESLVNVMAAAFLLWAVQAADEPPDEKHPYGHGKVEFVTAVFEGGLITFAAAMIAYEAIKSILNSSTPNLDQGLGIFIFSGALNGLLGLILIRIGKATSSLALEADGKHVLTDFMTTIGLILALGLVKITQISWLDPAIALVMAFLLAFTGIPLVRNAINGLIDAAELPLLEKILHSLERNRTPGFIRIHHVRAMRNGRRIHVDGYIVVPEFWSVEEAHDRTEDLESVIVKDIFLEGEMEFHVDPCRRLYCKYCDLMQCPLRKEDFVNRPPLTMEEFLRPDDITDRLNKS